MGLLKKVVTTTLAYVAMTTTASAEQVRVAVASNFSAAMADIVTGFEAASGHDVVLSFGSSGKIYAQIRNGAPFQVFLSADQAKPEALEQAGLVVAGSRFTYAIGTLALWSPEPGVIDGDDRRLRDGRFNKLALANPRLAPYGAAAVETLEALGLRQATEPQWVMGENIAQTYQFVATGNADLGFVALSQIMQEGQIWKGSSWIIPGNLHTPIRQDAVLLDAASDSAGARALLDYLRSDNARAIIQSYGYRTE